MVVLDQSGKTIEGKYKPSTDAPAHLMLYKEWDTVNGIVHTHSTFAPPGLRLGKLFPAFGTTHADHYFGEVPCTRKLTEQEIENDYEINTGK